jgi:hypothetical protein
MPVGSLCWAERRRGVNSRLAEELVHRVSGLVGFVYKRDEKGLPSGLHQSAHEGVMPMTEGATDRVLVSELGGLLFLEEKLESVVEGIAANRQLRLTLSL